MPAQSFEQIPAGLLPGSNRSLQIEVRINCFVVLGAEELVATGAIEAAAAAAVAEAAA
jgi:hypothetical protein